MRRLVLFCFAAHCIVCPAETAIAYKAMPLPRIHVGRTIGQLTAPLHLELYFDLHCPFAKRCFERLLEVKTNYGEQMSIRFINIVQPWHPQAFYMSRALEAAGILDETKYVDAMKAVFNKRESFSDEEVANKTPTQLYAILSETLAEVGFNAETAKEKMQSSEVLQQLKFHQRYARTRGVHVTPTVFVNGLEADTSSGWTLEQWKELLDPLLA